MEIILVIIIVVAVVLIIALVAVLSKPKGGRVSSVNRYNESLPNNQIPRPDSKKIYDSSDEYIDLHGNVKKKRSMGKDILGGLVLGLIVVGLGMLFAYWLYFK